MIKLKYVNVEHIGFDIGRTVDVKGISDLIHVAKVINKPILRIIGAELTHMGLTVLQAKAIYVVIDNQTYYRFVDKKKKEKKQ